MLAKMLLDAASDMSELESIFTALKAFLDGKHGFVSKSLMYQLALLVVPLSYCRSDWLKFASDRH